MEIKEQVKKFLCETATPDLEGWAWFNLPATDKFNYLVMLDWENGFDDEPDNPFIQDGYGLTVSIRVETGTYFKNDNPYPICTEQGDVIGSYTLSNGDIENGFADATDDIMAMYEQAKECENITEKFLQRV